MADTLFRMTVNALALVAAVKLVGGISFVGRWWEMLLVGAVFGVVNALIRPVLRFFAFPLIVITFGLFSFLINAAMLAITADVSGWFGLHFSVEGLWSALWGALIVSVVSMVLEGFGKGLRPDEGEGYKRG